MSSSQGFQLLDSEKTLARNLQSPHASNPLGGFATHDLCDWSLLLKTLE